MVIGRLFSRDSHLAFSLIFAGVAALLFAYEPHSYPGNPGPLLIPAALCALIIPLIGLALHRGEWMNTPFIGLAATVTSALYYTKVYPTAPCGSIVTSQGYPYPWIRHLIPPSDSRCPVYVQSTGYQIPIYGLYPSPAPAYIYIITDTVFYALLALSILELVAATRALRSTNRRRKDAGRSSVIQPSAS